MNSKARTGVFAGDLHGRLQSWCQTAEPTRHDTARISEEDQESTLAETTRLEAFSDGAFAIIITLLVLEIHRPDSATGQLAEELLKAWPSYLAYAVAFLYVG